MKSVTRLKTIGVFLIAFFLLGGVQQQAKGMEDSEKVDMITVELKDNKKIRVGHDVFELFFKYSTVINGMLRFGGFGANRNISLVRITLEQWKIIQSLLQLVDENEEKLLQKKIQLLTPQQLVSLCNNTNYLDIEIIMLEAITALAEVILPKLNFEQPVKLHNDFLRNNLKELHEDLQYLVKKELCLAVNRVMDKIFQ